MRNEEGFNMEIFSKRKHKVEETEVLINSILIDFGVIYISPTIFSENLVYKLIICYMYILWLLKDPDLNLDYVMRYKIIWETNKGKGRNTISKPPCLWCYKIQS